MSLAPAQPASSPLPQPLRVCAVERPGTAAGGCPVWWEGSLLGPLQDAAPSLPLSPGVCPHVSCLRHPESGPLAALLDVACWSQTCASVLHVRRCWWACALGPPSRVTEGSQSRPTLGGWGASRSHVLLPDARGLGSGTHAAGTGFSLAPGSCPSVNGAGAIPERLLESSRS